MAKLFYLIYNLILAPTLTRQLDPNPKVPNQMCADEYRLLLFFTLLNNFFW